MRLLNLLPLALSAGAFLVPADVHVEETKTLPISAKGETVELLCKGGCPVFTDGHSENGQPQTWTTLYPGKMVVDISVKDDKVFFNDKQIWPATGFTTLSVKQTTEGDTYKAFDGLMTVSAAVAWEHTEVLMDEKNLIKIHPISIEIFSLLGQLVYAQRLEIRVAETELGIALLPSRIKEYKPSPLTDNCTNVWCRVTGIIVQKFNDMREAASRKIQGWRGCGQSKVHKVNGLPVKGGPAKFGPGSSLNPNRHRHGKDQHHGKEQHHGHHKQHHGGQRGFWASFWEQLFFPGVFGLSVGLIFGYSCLLTLRALGRLRRQSQADYIVVEQVEVEEGLAGPPKYEEVYKEPQVESEDEKKELLQ